MLIINLHDYVEHSVDVHPPVTTHSLGLMVRGIFSSLHFPYAHFVISTNLTGESLLLILWEAIERLTCCSIYLVNSFVELTRYLLNLPCTTGHYLRIERFSQNPLENNFGQQRACGRYFHNPTMQACIASARSLRVQGSIAMVPVRGIQAERNALLRKQLVTHHYQNDHNISGYILN